MRARAVLVPPQPHRNYRHKNAQIVYLTFYLFSTSVRVFLRIFIAAHAAAALKKISLKRTTVSIVTRDAKIIRF